MAQTMEQQCAGIGIPLFDTPWAKASRLFDDGVVKKEAPPRGARVRSRYSPMERSGKSAHGRALGVTGLYVFRSEDGYGSGFGRLPIVRSGTSGIPARRRGNLRRGR